MRKKTVVNMKNASGRMRSQHKTGADRDDGRYEKVRASGREVV